jgi:transposase-like protein
MSHKLDQPEKNELLDLYSQEGSTISTLARHYNTSNPTVRKWLIAYDIERKSHTQASSEANRTKHDVYIPSREELSILYTENSIKFLEMYYGVGQKKIYEWLERYEIPKKTLSEACTTGKEKQHQAIQYTKNQLEQLYERDKPLAILADKLGVSYSHIRKLMKTHGIEVTKTWRSGPEISLYEYCKTTFAEYNWKHSDRKILEKLELDIVNHDLKLAIEYCGLYWHSEFYGGKNRNYHRDKFRECRAAGYNLITVFENDDPEKIVALLNKLHGKTKKVHARKCTIKSLSSQEASDFHQKHHLHGNHHSSIHYGLVSDSGELLMVISFGKSRFSKKYEYECVRMTCHSEYTVVGGASKLFTAFIREHNPSSIVTYSDLRFGMGNVYLHCGFEYMGMTQPNYWYFHRSSSERSSSRLSSRVKYQKHKLRNILEIFDDNLSEYQNMLANKFDRIWDCGNAKYIWTRD